MKNKTLWELAAAGALLAAAIPSRGGTPVLLTPAGAGGRYPDWAPGKGGR